MSVTLPPEEIFEVNELNLIEESLLRHENPGHQKLYSIIWIKEGSGHLSIDLKRLEFGKSNIFFLEPGQMCRLHSQAEIFGYHISFSASFLDLSDLCIPWSNRSASEDGGLFAPMIHGSMVIDDLDCLVQEMIKESANPNQATPELLGGLIEIFVMLVARNRKKTKNHSGTNHDGRLARKFLSSLYENIYTRKLVSDYASELSISANYLNQIMKRHTGFTASYHIQQYTILEAKRRAHYLGKTMKETAYYLGFDDLAHFSKFFKRNAGKSFRAFKNQFPSC